MEVRYYSGPISGFEKTSRRRTQSVFERSEYRRMPRTLPGRDKPRRMVWGIAGDPDATI